MNPQKRQEIVDRLTTRDILSVLRSAKCDDFDFIRAIIQGDGWIPYNQMTDDQLLGENETFEVDKEDEEEFSLILERIKG